LTIPGKPESQAMAKFDHESSRMIINPLDTQRMADAYHRLVASVGRAAPEVGDRRLTSHWPLVGSHFDHGVLVVGQAVYGWLPDWTALDATSAAGRSAILADTKASFADLDDPMSWIAGHRVENSPFWRTAHEVTDVLVPDPESPWFSRLAWANLYPIAPGAYKGNPEGTLRQVQTTEAAEFLGAVVDVLAPRLVLVLAGPFIWPFVEPLGLGGLARAAPPFTLVGRPRAGVPWICGMHPGGAQRRGWPARRYAELIITEAARLDMRR
jgi:hypothetical protein